MRLFRICSFLLFLCCAFSAMAQLPSTPEGIKQPRILILLDGSSSMLNPWGKDLQRFSAAAKVVSTLMDSVYKVNNQVEFALRVYGHQYPAQENNCTDTKREVMFSKDNYTQMALRMASLHPSGVSPIAYSLKEAAINDLQDELHNAYSIILVTDGGESCNGDICDVVRTLIAHKIFFKPYIISMLDYEPLRNQYACLGNYLTVGKESDIPVAVSAIVSDYRPMLRLPIIVASKPEPVDIKTLTIPKWIPEHSTVNTMDIVVKDKMPEVKHTSTPLPVTSKPDVVLSQIAPTPPDPVQPIQPLTFINKFKSTDVAFYTVNTQLPMLPRSWQKELSKIDPTPPDPVVAMESLRFISKFRAPQMFHYVRALHNTLRSDVALAKIVATPADPVVVTPPVPTPPPVVTKPAKDTAKTTVVIKELPFKPATNTKPEDKKPKELAYTSSSENSPEKGTRIYFTDGHGKFYKTSPKLQLADATGHVVKEFYRTVDASGNPDLQQLPGGTYTLIIPGRRNSVGRNLTIDATKLNKYVVVVSNGSLAFEYTGSPGKPVDEFEAIVNILFEPGPTIRQKCSLELEYTPGNYHVEVNTLPITKYNVDIDFGNTTMLGIKLPGFVQFTNTTAVGKIALYYPLGDRFTRFHIMDVSGNPETQKLRLQPGAYEVHWVKNPALPYGNETVQRFLVKSNAVTEIELH